MKDRLVIAVLLAFAFAAGVASSSNVIGLSRLFQGDVTVRCVEKSACVTDTVEAFLMHYDDDRGGLTGVFCELSQADREANRLAQYLFLRDIVQGQKCQSSNYLLEFRNPSTRTLVYVENGTVTKIKLGPLHIIDF